MTVKPLDLNNFGEDAPPVAGDGPSLSARALAGA